MASILKVKDKDGNIVDIPVMRGEQGPQGVTFTPAVSTEGVISWTNDGGLSNPAAISIKGPQGEQGPKGDAGETGPQGEQGPTGPAGPNEITGDTATTLNGLLKGNGATVQAATAGTDYMALPATATALPSSGTALTANTIYNVSAAVGTYAFTAPSSGWAHGKFTTGSSASVSFAGTFLCAAPTIEASKAYEFDVLDGVWAVAEVVSA